MDVDDNEDEIVRELDVYLNRDNVDFFILQFPLKPCYEECPFIAAAKFRSKHKKLELTVPYPQGILTSDERGDFGPYQTFLSTSVHQRSNLCVGVVKDGALHLSAVREVLQCRPSFKGLQPKIEYIDDDSSFDSNLEEEDSKPLQQVALKRKESERAQASRLQSYSYMQAQEDLEEWKELQVYDQTTEEVENFFECMYFET
jgi:hypothetical protein